MTILTLLSVALVACAFVARRRQRVSTHGVHIMLFALLPPIIGNMLIIASTVEPLAYLGCFLYFVGLDWTVLTLVLFATSYCSFTKGNYLWFKVLLAVVVLDSLQLLLNPVFHHAFSLQMIQVDGAPYYSLVPYAWQYVHRVVAYGIFFVSVGIFVYKTATSSRIYVERYLVILLSMLVAGLWETYYIFSGSPVDRSMMAFGFFGLLLFYFTVYYKPFRLLDGMLARVVETLDEYILFFDDEQKCIYVNDNARRFFGLPEESTNDALGRIESVVGSDLPLTLEWSMKRRVVIDGEVRFWIVETRNVSDSKGKQCGCVLSVRDVTGDERRLEREKQLARIDRLTGIYNKEYLYERVRELISRSPSMKFSAVAIDVKDFKIVNDIYSKEFGDEVLCFIARKLEENQKPCGAVYGRISGDKFGFVVPTDNLDVSALERRLIDYRIGEREASRTVIIHVGIYEIDDVSLPVSVMFDRAFMAIATVKSDYQRRVAYYDSAMREEAIWSQSISTMLDEAISTGQIRPYLQPLVDKSGKVTGAEVLVRWIHPQEGLMSPARFIPVFEANGMIARLDVFMWESACRLLKEWSSRGIDLFLSVNISPKDFYFIDVHSTLSALVDKYGIDPHRLRLEITETVMMSDLENRLKILESLQERGFIVEMDDFGSGYSSLNMLKDIPVDVLKIDMMFLYKTKDTQKAKLILQAIINLSRKLGIPSITEGVETEEQLTMLVGMGCELFQGYYFAKPMPVDDFESAYHGDAA